MLACLPLRHIPSTFTSQLFPFAAAVVSATYERCCVLFNIGSLQSDIAKSQNFDSDEGLKSAAKYFQVTDTVLTDLEFSHGGLWL